MECVPLSRCLTAGLTILLGSSFLLPLHQTGRYAWATALCAPPGAAAAWGARGARGEGALWAGCVAGELLQPAPRVRRTVDAVWAGAPRSPRTRLCTQTLACRTERAAGGGGDEPPV